ncbi:MAG: VWA-like domain-containing protein [Gammaproteobacteria bacterium]|nr:VWA-like domain-containing protein [Gammaproteobacteria bacterium]
MSTEREQKLSRARTRLVLDHPFIGSLVLHLELKPAQGDWCKTTATNAKKIFYNEEYIDALTPAETLHVLAHEALHCGLSHFARKGQRDKTRWDLACDFAVNSILKAEGMNGPPGTLYEASFDGMTAEEIYPYMEEHEDKERQDDHMFGDEGGEGQSEQRDKNNMSAQESSLLDKQWQTRLTNALQQAAQAGKLKGDLKRMIKSLLDAQLPWRNMLAYYMSQIARDDYKYHRPSSRRGGDVIYPSLRSEYADVFVVLDTSGSVTNAELNRFISEIDAIKGQARARITLFACDAEITPPTPLTFEAWETLEIPKDLQGGGGTSFKPVFEYIEKEFLRPDLLIYFTDAEGVFPKLAPNFPVIWLVKGKREVPWGQRVQLN